MVLTAKEARERGYRVERLSNGLVRVDSIGSGLVGLYEPRSCGHVYRSGDLRLGGPGFTSDLRTLEGFFGVQSLSL